jgi:NitT/TauT family transport system permease protein
MVSGLDAQWQRRRRSIVSFGPPILLFGILLVVWEIAVRSLQVPTIILPRPSLIVAALADGLNRGTYFNDIYVTTIETIIGFAAGAVIGVVIGVAVAEIRSVERFVYPYVVSFQAIPKLAIAPIIIIWLGFGLGSKIAVVALVSFFPITVTTVQGLRAASSAQIEMLRSFGASHWQIMRMVRLPTAMPFLFAGLDVAAVTAVLGAVVAEWLGADAGLGSLILRQTYQLDVAGMFAVLIILSVMGIAAHFGVRVFERRVVFWEQ